MLLEKALLLGCSALGFERSLAMKDYCCAFGGEAILALLLALPLVVGATLVRVGGPRMVRAGCRSLGALLLTVVAIASLASWWAYVLSGWAFQEWGSYLQPTHVRSAIRAGFAESLGQYLRDSRALIAAPAALVFPVAVGWWTQRDRHQRLVRYHRPGLCWSALLLLGVSGLAPFLNEGAFDYSVPSPLLSFWKGVGRHLRGFDTERRMVDPALYVEREPASQIPEEWRALARSAEGMDLVLVVLESTRRQSVSLYREDRDTTPRLRRAAEHGLVFQNSYVSIPTSNKTMESLLLGVDPDPRPRSMCWQSHDLVVQDSFLGRLAERGYRLYFGTSFALESDCFGAFWKMLGGSALDRCVGESELGRKRVHPVRGTFDDRVVVGDYLSWRETLDGPTAAMVWLQGAHHPYNPLVRQFEENSLQDRYDNCLYSADLALGSLLDGIHRAGRSESTLVVVLGDHGEALGERLDVGHGSWFYDHSIRIPQVWIQPKLFPVRRDCSSRFTPRDLPGTLLWMLGDTRPLHQSKVLFRWDSTSPIHFANPYQEYKLGLLSEGRKWTYEVDRNRLSYVSEFQREDGTQPILVGPTEGDSIREQILAWYYHQVQYVEQRFGATARLPDVPITLESHTEVGPRGEELIVRVRGDRPGGSVILCAVGCGGRPIWQKVLRAKLDSSGEWVARVAREPADSRVEVALLAFLLADHHRLGKSEVLVVEVPVQGGGSMGPQSRESLSQGGGQ